MSPLWYLLMINVAHTPRPKKKLSWRPVPSGSVTSMGYRHAFLETKSSSWRSTDRKVDPISLTASGKAYFTVSWNQGRGSACPCPGFSISERLLAADRTVSACQRQWKLGSPNASTCSKTIRACLPSWRGMSIVAQLRPYHVPPARRPALCRMMSDRRSNGTADHESSVGQI